MSNIGYEDPSLNNANSLLNTDIPVFDNAVPTILSINTGSQSNSDILGSVESANLVPDATPGSGSLFPSDPAELPQINSLFELLQYLSEVIITMPILMMIIMHSQELQLELILRMGLMVLITICMLLLMI